jgi:hypothetical protein
MRRVITLFSPVILVIYAVCVYYILTYDTNSALDWRRTCLLAIVAANAVCMFMPHSHIIQVLVASYGAGTALWTLVTIPGVHDTNATFFSGGAR